MDLTLFSAAPADDGLAGALEAEGFEVERCALPSEAGGPTPLLAATLRSVEAALGDEAPAVVVISAPGDAALAAALATVKLGIPTVWLRPPGAPDADGLVGRVADLELDATQAAASLARSIRDMTPPRISRS